MVSYPMTYFHFVLIIPCATSITFDFKNIGPKNQNREIVKQGLGGAYISDSGIQVTRYWKFGPSFSGHAGRATYFKPFHL